VQLGFKNPQRNFHSPALSPGASTLYFDANSEWGGYRGKDFRQVESIPPVDFNCNEIVDMADSGRQRYLKGRQLEQVAALFLTTFIESKVD
jgi:hypothetical protein